MPGYRNLLQKIKQSPRLYKYFFSYVLILVITLSIVSSVVYSNFFSILKSEVEASNISVLTQIKDMMDTRMKEMHQTAVNIDLNVDLKPYKVFSGAIDEQKAVIELGKYKSSNEFLYDIALFYNYNGKQRVFTTKTAGGLDFFFTYLYKFEDWGKERFLDLLQKLKYPAIRGNSPVYIDQVQKRDFITYIYPILFNQQIPNGVLIFMIDGSILEKTIQNALKEYSGYVYILDAGGNTIISMNDDTMQIPSNELLEEIKGSLDSRKKITILDRNYAVTKVESDFNSWSYITVMPEEQLFGKVIQSRSLFNAVIASILFLGTFLAVVMAAKNYKPLAKLMDMVEENDKKRNLRKYADEFTYLSQTIHEVSSENKGLTEQLKNKAAMMKGQLLQKLVRGKFDNPEDIRKMADVSGIKLDKSCFAVLVFYIDDFKRFISGNDEKNQNLLRFCIINVAEELSEELGTGYGMELEDETGVALLLNMDSEYDSEDYLKGLAIKTKGFMRQNFNLSLTAGIGSVYYSFDSIKDSYLEASRAASYRFVKGNGNVIFYHEVQKIGSKELVYPFGLDNELVMAIKQGKSNEIENIIKNIVSQVIEQETGLESVRFFCSSLVNSVYKCMEELSIQPDHELASGKEQLLMKSFETINHFADQMIEFCIRLCHYIISNKESRNFNLREKIIEIIDRNYSENSLCLEYIADKCGVSSSYLSRYFKDQTGLSISQYIDNVRMNIVKEMLKTTELPLRDMLDRIGYLDESSFIRKFKKKEGMTPIQYRKITKNQIN